MPIYDYACQSCGQAVELMHGVNEPGPARCERCGGPMRKLLSAPAIVFRGSGWAKMDARAARPSGAVKTGADTEADHRSPKEAETAKGGDAGSGGGGASRPGATDKPSGGAPSGKT